VKKISLFIIGTIILIAIKVTAQNPSDSIEIHRGFGMEFIQHDTAFTKIEILEIMKINPEALHEMWLARTNYTLGNIIRFGGGIFVFLPIGAKIAGLKPNWTLLGIGAGLMAVSLPFAGSGSAHAEKAVDIYNRGLKQANNTIPKYQFGLTSDGIGIRIRL
jgi:hypothetical protein